jgi:cellulose synthase/poly-beta-1,6-N-acetylglucosamine synthase-like glycosyltransferase
MSDCIGVVIPLHNKQAYVHRAIESVLRQSHQALQLTIVDDGSTDDGAEFVRRVADSRVRLVRTACYGPGAARNLGMRITETEWLAFLDADDCWEPSFLEKTRNAASQFPTVVAVFTGIHSNWSNAGSYTAVGGVMEDYLAARMRLSISMSSSTVLVRRSTFASIGGFREDTRYAEDTEAWFRLSCEGPSYYIPEPLARIEMQDPTSTTRSADSMARAAGLQLLLDSYERYRGGARIPPHCVASCRRFMQHQRGRLALHLLHAGKHSAGVRALLAGVPPGTHTWREYLQCAVVLLKARGR